MRITKRKPTAILLTLVILSTAGGPGRSQQAADPVGAKADQPPRRDLYGDPLPPGALVRLGTVRLQHDGEVTSGLFSADGTTLTTAGLDCTVRRWDLATARELQRFTLLDKPEEMQQHRRHLLSPDGKTLATIHTRQTGATWVYSICLWEVATGKHRFLDGHPQGQHYFLRLAFSPDSTQVAAASSDKDVRFWDVASAALMRQLTAPGSVEALGFAPNGARVAASTPKGLVVIDAATGTEVRQLPRENAGLTWAFSPDAQQLAVADSPVRIWDVATGKTLLEMKLDERVDLGGGSTIVRLPRDVVFSADGKLIAVDINGTVALVDAVTGARVRTFLGDRRTAGRRVFFSSDGRHIAVPGQLNYFLYETATGKTLHHDVGHQGSVKSIAFAPDGKTLATADLGAVRLWDAATGKEQRRWPGYLVRDRSTLAFAPDGRSLVHAGGLTIRLWDPTTGAELPHFKTLQAGAAAFASDGVHLATMSANGPALWDVATGKNLRPFDKENQRSDVMAFAPDGKTLAGLGGALFLWDTATGKRRHKIEPPATNDRFGMTIYSAVAFSPDGAHVAAFGGRTLPTDSQTLSMYDVATGKQVGRFHTTDCQKCHMVLAFAPDGKTLAMGDSTRDITLWEVLTGQPRAKLTGHRRYMEALAFAPDGQRLASASADGTALVWDLRAAAKRTAASSEDCWRNLSGDDAVAAYDAMHALIRLPAQALPLLRQGLKPVNAVEPRRLETLLTDLDSNSFSTRQKATDELEKLGTLAEAALNKALADKPPLEVRQRLEKLLDRLATIQVAAPDVLQALRGVEVLEHIGSAEAREILQTLAGGAPDARQTREAKSALQRLVARDARSPGDRGR